MSFTDPSMALLAAGSQLLAVSGGETVKLFDVSSGSGGPGPHDPCILTYTPSPGFQVNSVKWNHTNLVVASSGDDKKISLWRRDGQSLGTIPLAGNDSADNIEESIMSINFSNKVSRYLCSGGSGQVVRIWDLQRKRCIKWLRGHSDTITGASYNCKDEHLASINLKGDLIVHNLASGARAAELKDPNEQVLRVLDYSRISRHLLATSGDDGTVHLWDTTGRSPKVSWLNQHSAPTAGLSFSPSNDKMIASVGLDKKLYTFDAGTRRPSFCIPYEAPFTSLAFRDDGLILAAGTSSGRVVFYDVRGKPQPLTILRAYSSSEAVTSICWQRSKHVTVNENCTAETALLGGAVEDSILMPDPLPSATSSGLSLSSTIPISRNPGRSGSSAELSSFPAVSGVSLSKTRSLSTEEEASIGSSLWKGGTLARLHAPRSYNFKDDMEVFSPLVEVKPITPSLDKLWDNSKKDYQKKASLPFTLSRRLGNIEPHPVLDWKSSSFVKEDDSHSSFSQSESTPASLRSIDSTIINPPEACVSDKSSQQRPSVTLPSRFALLTSNSLTSGSSSLGLQDLSPANQAHVPVSSTSLSLGSKSITTAANLEPPTSTWTIPRRFSTYAERISTASSFSDGSSLPMSSPKTKKTGAETREELLNCLSTSDASSVPEAGILPSANGGIVQPRKTRLDSDPQVGSSFTLQLYQRTLEETLSSFQKSIHEDMRNLHIEVLRQFHMQEMEFSSAMNAILDNQAELMREVQSLRKENQQLRQLL